MPGPLSHVKVVDLSRVLAAPWTGQNLADLGAEVIKVERPGKGDDSRAFGPPWLKDRNGNDTAESAYFASANRGKKSITLDLSKPAGQDIVRELSQTDLGSGVTFRLKGEDEERAKAGAFLMKAFGTAIFLIFAILLAQFNRLTSVGLVLSAVILSTIGVQLGLMVMGQPFGVVMTGIGVIANAGVIVNNNIVLIDTYDRLRREGWEAYDAIVETCRERARPVVLTAVTAVLGVLPIAFGVNIEFLTREISVGAPATQWWISLSTAIVFGLGFATVLTLFVTPAALMAIELMRRRREVWARALRARFARAPQ